MDASVAESSVRKPTSSSSSTPARGCCSRCVRSSLYPRIVVASVISRRTRNDVSCVCDVAQSASGSFQKALVAALLIGVPSTETVLFADVGAAIKLSSVNIHSSTTISSRKVSSFDLDTPQNAAFKWIAVTCILPTKPKSAFTPVLLLTIF